MFEYLTLICTLAAISVGVSLFLFRKNNDEKQPFNIPLHSGYPIIGNLLDLQPGNILDSFSDILKKHGPFVKLTAFNTKMLLISDPVISKEILTKRPKVFRRVRSLDYSAEALGLSSGLFHTFGSDWNRIRKLTSPSLAKHHVINNLKGMIEEGRQLIDRLTAKSDGTTVVEVKDALFQYTLRVICRSAFGIKLTGDAEDYFLGSVFPKDLLSIFEFMMESATFPFPKWLWHCIPFFHQLETRAKEGDKRFDSMCRKIVAMKKAELSSDPSHSNNFSVLDILINHEQTPSDVDGGAITDNEIIANIKTFFIAGSDTTSVVLSWSLFFLAQHKDLLAELRVEVDAFFATYNADETSSTELLNMISKDRMPLANAVIKETTRLYTPGAMVLSQLEKQYDRFVLSNGIVIAPDVEVITFLDAIQHDESVYSNGKSFVPKRWLTQDKELLAKMESSYVAFGYGPRACPGMNLAVCEALIGLATLVHSLDFELACPASEIKRVVNIAALPTKMPMTFTKRAVA